MMKMEKLFFIWSMFICLSKMLFSPLEYLLVHLRLLLPKVHFRVEGNITQSHGVLIHKYIQRSELIANCYLRRLPSDSDLLAFSLFLQYALWAAAPFIWQKTFLDKKIFLFFLLERNINNIWSFRFDFIYFFLISRDKIKITV